MEFFIVVYLIGEMLKRYSLRKTLFFLRESFVIFLCKFRLGALKGGIWSCWTGVVPAKARGYLQFFRSVEVCSKVYIPCLLPKELVM
ncbi:hypothetical protein SAMN04488522_105215 [Pedobacter caeni]|uniref:Uncharacterized protein n=1 Tax=Pedobacter caeni TaxID=288992 RepID=A0A1M5J635_9SPHI|nr:hypothetical protein SAMN04488522_105215 [Pedobacter caeni]